MERTEALEKLNANLKGSLFRCDDAYVSNLLRLHWDETSARRLAAWDWPHGIGLFGLWKRYLLSGDEEILDYLVSWYDSRLEIGLPEKTVNTVAPFLTLAFLDEKRPDPKRESIMREWAGWIMHGMDRTEEDGIQHKHAELVNHGDLWDDTLFMTCLFLAKAGMLFHEGSWVAEAEYQTLLHMKYLVDRKSGLWYHAWNFDNRNNYAGALWGRGNCWITLYIPEFLDIVTDCPSAIRRSLLSALECQVRSLRGYQDETGLWHTLIDDPSSYLESSASAGFCAGILKAVRKGFLPPEYVPVAGKALQALIPEIGEDGVLHHVSYGTNVGATLDSYKKIPQRPMQYGQGLAMLALCEAEAAFKEGIL